MGNADQSDRGRRREGISPASGSTTIAPSKVQAEDANAPANTANFTSWTRLKPAWLTIGAMTLPRDQ